MKKPATRITRRRLDGPRHAVISIITSGGRAAYRREPCAECPWRVDQVGAFPAEAFRLSAPTAYDAAMSKRGRAVGA
jgi:hypothetical protein